MLVAFLSNKFECTPDTLRTEETIPEVRPFEYWRTEILLTPLLRSKGFYSSTWVHYVGFHSLENWFLFYCQQLFLFLGLLLSLDIVQSVLSRRYEGQWPPGHILNNERIYPHLLEGTDKSYYHILKLFTKVGCFHYPPELRILLVVDLGIQPILWRIPTLTERSPTHHITAEYPQLETVHPLRIELFLVY